jgi:NTE family protein
VKDKSGSAPRRAKTRRINLALQGGGAHGAFTWGVVDALLADGRFVFEGISGASAGAINAVCIVDGYQEAGADGARERLSQLWSAIGRSSRFSPLQRTPVDAWFGRWSIESSPFLAIFDLVSRVASPYDLNPLDINPLRDIVAEVVRFENVRACKNLSVFIAATNVWNGKVRIFKNAEIDIDATMASSCLPFLFKAVEINGVPYWDGGYMGNPVLFPFFYDTGTEDILLVQINPIERPATPKSAREIAERVDEITFNASLLREFRAIEFVHRLLDDGVLSPDHYKRIRMHRISVPDEVVQLHASSKLVAEPEFLDYLRGLGADAAREWLAKDSDKVGKEPGIDLSSEISYGLDGDWYEEIGEEAAAEIRRGIEEGRKPGRLPGAQE